MFLRKTRPCMQGVLLGFTLLLVLDGNNNLYIFLFFLFLFLFCFWFFLLVNRKLKPWMQMISWPDKWNNLTKRRESCR